MRVVRRIHPSWQVSSSTENVLRQANEEERTGAFPLLPLAMLPLEFTIGILRKEVAKMAKRYIHIGLQRARDMRRSHNFFLSLALPCVYVPKAIMYVI